MFDQTKNNNNKTFVYRNRHSAEILSSNDLINLGRESSEKAPASLDEAAGKKALATPPATSSGPPSNHAHLRSDSLRHRRSASDFPVVQLPAAYVFMIMLFTLSLRMKECVRMSEVRNLHAHWLSRVISVMVLPMSLQVSLLDVS